VRLDPERSIQLDEACPECGRPVTIGVLHRVAELADRPVGFRPPGGRRFTSPVQLPQIIAEIMGTGPESEMVAAEVSRLVAALGPELAIHTEADGEGQRGRPGPGPRRPALAPINWPRQTDAELPIQPAGSHGSGRR